MQGERISPQRAGLIAAGLALVVAFAWYARHTAKPSAQTVDESTIAISITRHDAFGAPSKPARTGDPARVHAILASIGADTQPPIPCPPDYATADLGLLLTGRDVYARKNAYVWDLANAPHVAIVDETGCRGGPVVDPTRLRSAL